MNNNFYVIANNTDDEYYLSELASFIISGYECELGINFNDYEKCYIYNDADAECPMFIINTNPVKIRLAQASTSYWAQSIYQLSHEMCHYLFRQYKSNKNFTLRWYEEVVCEAVSLYFLNYGYRCWQHCSLKSFNNGFDKSIREYLLNELNKCGTDELKNCTTKDSLLEYEVSGVYNRQSHYNERNLLYNGLCVFKTGFSALLDYEKYLNKDKVTFNYDRWKGVVSTELIDIIKIIQPVKD